MYFADRQLLSHVRLAAPDANRHTVTSSPLIAAAVQRQYASTQLSSGSRTWAQPVVLSLPAWLQQILRRERSSSSQRLPLLLSSHQELYLWVQAIEEAGAPVLDLHRTARSAASAARLAAAWQLPLHHDAWEQAEDTSHFHRWYSAILTRCRENNWLLPSHLLTYIASNIGTLHLPRHLSLAGFFEPSAALRTFIEAAQSSGITVDESSGSYSAPSAGASIPCNDPADEIEAAARWARSLLDSNPNQSIALFVRNLEESRSLVARTLGSILQPAAVLHPLDPPSTTSPLSAFYIHSGTPYRDKPLIAAALAVLELARPLIPMATISSFLSSPYLPGVAEERAARARIDAKLRRLRELELPFSLVLSAANSAPILNSLLKKVATTLRKEPAGTAEPAVWSRFWRQLLTACEWPGLSVFPSDADTLDEWSGLLTAFDSLAISGCVFDCSTAAAELASLASAPVQPSLDLAAPIQVLDPASARPLRFDAAWMTGASELDWPPLSLPPAYLPYSLLRAAGVPNAAASSRRKQSEALSRYIETCAPTVIASFSAPDAEGAALSPLFHPLQQLSLPDLHAWNGVTLLSQVQLETLEKIEDTNGPPLPPGTLATGGSSLLKSQSQCPFQAFAQRRLLADALEEGDFAYDHRDRGEFLHAALAYLWSEIKDSETLRALSPQELTAIAESAAQKALASDAADTTFRRQLQASEAARIKAVILDWLEIEKKRPGNFKIHQAENATEFVLDGLALKLRADRIDQLDDGSLVIIDYKSGVAKRKFLDSDRPSEPQLLTYATMLGERDQASVDGLYFARLSGRACLVDGYGRIRHFEKATAVPNWNGQLNEWTRIIHSLANEFTSGKAVRTSSVKPCRYCKVRPVCRIEESRRNAGNEESD